LRNDFFLDYYLIIDDFSVSKGRVGKSQQIERPKAQFQREFESGPDFLSRSLALLVGIWCLGLGACTQGIVIRQTLFKPLPLARS